MTTEALAERLEAKRSGEGYRAERAVESVGVAQAVAKRLGLDKSTVSRRVKVALADSYLQNEEPRKGQAMKLVGGDPLPEAQPLLPDPATLEDCCTVAPLQEAQLLPSPCTITKSALSGRTMSPSSNLVTFRGGFTADWSVVVRLLEIEAKGVRFELADRGRFRVVPGSALTPVDRSFLATNETKYTQSSPTTVPEEQL